MGFSKIDGIKFYSDDLELEVTIKEFLKELLCKLWVEEESFSGKRPFGNGGWQYNVYAALIKNGIVKGVIDEDGCVEEFDHGEIDSVITKYIIEHM